jgi:hypothetical protein
MSPLMLPDEIKLMLRNKLENWYKDNKDSKLFSVNEKSQIERLIDYLEVVNRGHNTTELEKGLQFHDFKSFYVQYDIRRNKNFLETFPELKEWYESIEIDNNIPKREIFDGSITNYEAGEYISDKENNNK